MPSTPVPSASGSAPAPGAYPHTMRLQRFLARAGVASRRGAENLMTAGRVTVNGVRATELGTKVDVDRDRVAVDGVPVALAAGPTYLLLNKPAGVLTTMSDPEGRPCVAALVPREAHPGLFPVGRLDKDTTGALLFTTDGDLAQALLHPSHHVEKRYLALVDGHMSDAELEPLRRGMVLDDGPCKPARCRLIDAAAARPICKGGIPKGSTAVEVVLSEGRKNQVKRMLGAVHHPVLRLHRARFGPLGVTGLAPGAWRYLEDDEVAALRRAAARPEEAPPPAPARSPR